MTAATHWAGDWAQFVVEVFVVDCCYNDCGRSLYCQNEGCDRSWYFQDDYVVEDGILCITIVVVDCLEIDVVVAVGWVVDRFVETEADTIDDTRPCMFCVTFDQSDVVVEVSVVEEASVVDADELLLPDSRHT